jgi:DNA-binding response OmpR family regulator
MTHQNKVLIIEDDQMFRMTLSAFLEDSGYLVMEAADGAEGVDLFSREHPDIVLTDLRMPVLDGFGVIVRLREMSPGTPVIVVTGTGDAAALVEASHLGAWGALTKPIADLAMLEFAMDEALLQSERSGTLPSEVA